VNRGLEGSEPAAFGRDTITTATLQEKLCAAAAAAAGVGAGGAGAGVGGGIAVGKLAYEYCMGRAPAWAYLPD
jgi:hypothetical protein